MQLTRLIYTSNHGGIEKKDLEEILETSKSNNDKDGITGLLISSDEDFIQLVEGGRTAVSKCFMRIMQDYRHQGIKILLASPIQSRLFDKWGMCLIDITAPESGSIKDYFLNGVFDADEMTHEEIENLFVDLSKNLNRVPA